MTRNSLAILACMLLHLGLPPAVAQADVTLRGQFRDLLFVPHAGETTALAGWNGIRLDLAASAANDNLRFRASLDFFYGFGAVTALDLGAGLTGPEGLPAVLLDGDGQRQRLHIDLFRAFVQYRAPDNGLEISLGRQRIAWGAGLILRPANAFEPTDVFDPYRELSGVHALRLTIPVSAAVYVDTLAALETQTGRSQTGIAAGIRKQDSIEAALSFVHDHLHGREQIGLSLVGIGAVRYWLDGAWRIQTRESDNAFADRHQLLLEAGLEYTVPVDVGLSLAAEYLFLSNGDAAGGGALRADALEDYRVLQARDYLYLQAQLAVKERLNAGLGMLVNIDDGSTALLPRVTGRPVDTLELSLGAQLFIGRGGDEFGRSDLSEDGRGAGLYYLMTTWYFY